ncbi:MAG: flippase [Aliishimia sp.]
MKRLKRLLHSDTGKLMVPSFAIAFLARLMQLAMAVLAARILLPEGYGVFTFALGVGLLGGRIGALGWPMLMNRFIPRYSIDQKWGLLRGFMRAAHGVISLSGLVVSILCIVTGFYLGPDSHLYLGLILGGILLPIMAFRALYRNILAALRLPQNGIFIDELMPSTIMTACLLVLLNQTIAPHTAIGLYIAASVTAVGFGAFWIRRKLPQEMAEAEPIYTLRSWMRIAFPALVGTSSKLLMNKTDVLMLAPLATMADVGLYGAALRVTSIQTAPVVVLSTVITARISEAFAAGRDAQGKRLFYLAYGFAAIYATAFAVLVILFSETVIISLFGAAYAEGATVLSILAVAQIGSAVNTPASAFMLMTGREGAFGKMTSFALVINVALNLWLIPTMGAEGAALATCCSIWLLGVLQMTACMKIVRSGEFKDKPQT